ncbi:MAG: PaaI family thioesterase [Chitinophagales bacterium]|nr:PaaI family thioesterase [Chitinophagales bacterium]HMV14731.1 PaaI family thioesterase [Chitinophagales bacterium]HMW12537.1 PaaI family thioesterase [Chitinophagales bacterium]HMX60106.1 PaaI family thioesterase [Chitinophagales bacterium]HMY23795.1 PaaI family thioesterase [Chitinophagales bacterium]
MNKRIDFLRSQIDKEQWQYDYPLMDWLRARVVAVDEGYVKMQFTVEKYMLNPIGIMHGGIMATVLDEVMGAASFTLGRPNGFATVNMNVDYLNPAKLGETIFAIGKIVRAGKTILHIEASIVNANDKLLAKATSNMIVTAVQLPI